MDLEYELWLNRIGILSFAYFQYTLTGLSFNKGHNLVYIPVCFLVYIYKLWLVKVGYAYTDYHSDVMKSTKIVAVSEEACFSHLCCKQKTE